ncbi:hypothetical protein BJF79_41235 [Actinomadura sp. CNU-125]|nr:hypothetical protein BJF79_41235 [Actinomadura sp. CNU-125]
MLLLQRHCERQVGGPEPDAHDVMDEGLHTLLRHQADSAFAAAPAIFGTTLSMRYGTASGVGVRSVQNSCRSIGT